MLALIGFCLLSSCGAVVYAGATGERWPLLFASSMLVLSLVTGIAMLLFDRTDDR